MSKKQLDELLGLESFSPLKSPEKIRGGEGVRVDRVGNTRKRLVRHETVTPH